MFDIKEHPMMDSDIKKVESNKDTVALYFDQGDFQEKYLHLYRDDVIVLARHFSITQDEIDKI